MPIPLAEHAKRWMHLLHFQDKLPNLIDESDEIDEVSFFAELSGHFLANMDRDTNHPLNYQQEKIPFWVIFAMPKRPAVVNLASYLNSVKFKNEDLYQKILSDYDPVLPSFIREQLFLFGITQSFRKLCNLPILNHEYTVSFDITQEIKELILPLTTPLGILDYIAERITNKTISAGIALFRKIETLSYSIREGKTLEEVTSAVKNFQKFLDEMSTFSDHTREIEEIDVEKTIEQLKVKCKEENSQITSEEYDDKEVEKDQIAQEENPLPDFETWDILEAIYMRRRDYDYIRVTHYNNGIHSVVATELEFFDRYVTSKSHVKWFKNESLASNYHKKIMHRRIKSGFEILSVNNKYREINDFPEYTRYISPLTYGTDFGKFYINNNQVQKAINLFLKLYQLHPYSKKIKEILIALDVELENLHDS